MIILFWQPPLIPSPAGAGTPSRGLPRIIDDPRFDRDAIEEEIIVTVIAAFLKAEVWRH